MEQGQQRMYTSNITIDDPDKWNTSEEQPELISDDKLPLYKKYKKQHTDEMKNGDYVRIDKTIKGVYYV